MKVWYLHGLESAPGGPKVDFLNEVADDVYAPAMDYTSHKAFGELYREITKKGKPDLIIGSSMGGYFADAIASHFGIKTILFNPALHSRSIDYNFRYGKEGYKRTIVLGKDDTVILPERTKEIVGDTAKIINIEGMGHRTLQETFQAIYSKYFIDETA